jgi:hypothetical protein
MKLVRSTIDSDHASWLCIARHVASLSRRDRLSRAMSSMVASLMSFDIWLKDISVECQMVLHSGTEDKVLPPLVCANPSHPVAIRTASASSGTLRDR